MTSEFQQLNESSDKNLKPSLNGQKRKLEEDVKIDLNEANTQVTPGIKKVVHDGYSWWTCLTMGMPVENSQPHSVPKQPQGLKHDMDIGCLPSKPERPLVSDCCGQGCDPCILDIYAEEVRIWEEECQRLKDGRTEDTKPWQQEKLPESGPKLSITEYTRFTIDFVEKETCDSYRYRFSLPTGTTLGLKAGQHVVIRGIVGGEIISRQYTPVSDIGAKSFFELLIKSNLSTKTTMGMTTKWSLEAGGLCSELKLFFKMIYENGRMSQIVKTWTVGTEFRKLYMICVGTGIAPMAQLVQTVLNNEEDETVITLLYGCKTYKDILLKARLDEWSRYWNFFCTYYLSQEDGSRNRSSYRYGDNISTSRITCDHVLSVISDLKENFLVLICGTRSFEQDMIQCMKSIGVSEQKYHKF